MPKNMKTNCYHIRNINGERIIGGMNHCTSYDEAVDHATAGLTVEVTSGGIPRFMKDGKPVDVYVSVHPEHTKKGVEALKQYRIKVLNEDADDNDDDF